MRSRQLVRIGWGRAERLDGPLLGVVGDLLAEFATPLVGGVGELGQVGLPLRVVDLGQPVGVTVADRVERCPLGDPVVQNVGQLPGAGQRAARDGLGEDLARVVPGELGAAQQPGQGRAAVFDGDPGALVVG
jgi:hypothetical protein